MFFVLNTKNIWEKEWKKKKKPSNNSYNNIVVWNTKIIYPINLLKSK